MRRIVAFVGLVALTAACSEKAGGLLGNGRHDGDAGPGGGTVAPTCESTAVDPRADRLALHRLAFALAPAIIVGRLGPTEPDPNGERWWWRAFDIEEVRYGVDALVGRRVWFQGTPEELEGLPDVPFVAGFGKRNPGPVDFGDGRVVWQPHVLRPLADTGPLEDLLGYRAAPGPHVGVVRVTDQTERQTRFEVVETLQGELPASFSTPSTNPRNAPGFPPPGDATYLVSLKFVGPASSSTVSIGRPVDFRADTPEHRAMVAQAFAAPPPVEGVPAAAAADYRAAWDYVRADHVVRAEVVGLSFDNGTGAGGMMLRNEVVETIRGPLEDPRFHDGGHGQYFDERCGAEQLYALRANVAVQAIGATFDCEGQANFPPYESYSGAIIDRRPTPDEARVRSWALAMPPPLRLWPPSADLDLDDAVPPSGAPLATPPGWATALAAGRFTWVRVREQTEHSDGWFETTVELTFDELGPPIREASVARLATVCPQAHLEPGSEWLVGYFVDAGFWGPGALEYGPQTSTLFPGPWLPATDFNVQTLRALIYDDAIRRTE